MEERMLFHFFYHMVKSNNRTAAEKKHIAAATCCRRRILQGKQTRMGSKSWGAGCLGKWNGKEKGVW